MCCQEKRKEGGKKSEAKINRQKLAATNAETKQQQLGTRQ